MSISKSKQYNNKVFEVGELYKAFSEPATSLGQAVKRLLLQEWLPDGSLSSDFYSDLTSLEKVCDLSTYSVNVECTDKNLDITITAQRGAILVSGRAGSASTLTEAFQSLEASLELTAYEKIKEDSPGQAPAISLEDLASRIQVLELKVLASRNLKCFLSYRFTQPNEPQALRLQRFLDLLGVRVTTGASYEPRRVTEKILSRLEDALDFVVVLITEDGESYWTRDETAAAIHKKIPLIPIVQEGVEFTPGLFGDIEYINFAKDHIGDAFLKLLEAVTFIKNETTEGDAETEPKT